MFPFGPYSIRSWLAAFALTAGVVGLRAEPIINELMASNSTTLMDEDGAYSDWIELRNPDAVAADLTGWYLTDNASNKTKWQFPSVTIPAHGYLVVFASNKNRRDPAGRLHTNFALSASGEYLALVHADGVTTASEFSPTFPALDPDVSYGLPGTGDRTTAALLAKPTPGAANSGARTGSLTDTVGFSRSAGPFRYPFSLELTGAGADEHIRYVITTGLAVANAPEPTAQSTQYKTALAVSSTAVIRAAVFSADDSSHGPVTTVYYAKLASNLTNFSSQLPVTVIDTMGSGALVKDDTDHPSWLYSYGAAGNGTASFSSSPELASPLTTTVRGSSSANFPKKGLNLKFTNETGAKASIGLVDLPAYEKWALVAPWSYDPGFINNSFIYSLSNQIGRWAPRTRMTEVFINSGGDEIDQSDYAGIYAITDRIEIAKDRVDLTSLSSTDISGSAVTGGYILKIDTKDAGEIGWSTQHGIPGVNDSAIVLVSPSADEVAPAQVDYIRDYVQKMENALFSDRGGGWAQRTYLDYIDRGSWVDHHILNVFSCNPDAFTRSAYFTKNRNGKLSAGPVWDFDRALGSYQDDRSFRYDVWQGVGVPDLWRVGWWGVIAQDPEFMQDWVDRWQSLRRTEFSPDNLRSLIDSLSAGVGAEAAARDASRWPDDTSPYGSYAAQIEHMKGWVTLRAEWIDRQFVAAPATATSGGSLIFTASSGAQLAYTLDGSDPRSLGGEVAPNAILTSSALTVPASANVHVRSYRADLRGVFPGSPWSSAVGGDASSPLSPRARLVNISSRAIVGTGENALIAGVVVADTEAKRYLSRAVGPGLAAFGASGVVPDPQLSIFSGNGVELFRNNGWEIGPDATQLPYYSKLVGAFPLSTGSRDSALASSVSAGAYTVQVTTPTGQNGVGLAELYELDSNGRTVNLSTRAYVHTGEGVLIGGFVVQGPAYKRMLIRAVGPTLGAFGLTNALADPILTVYSGQTIVATNDRWGAAENASAVVTASKNAGAFTLAPQSEDAAMLVTLPPGAYTVEVKGKGGAEGVALLEIYDVP